MTIIDNRTRTTIAAPLLIPGDSFRVMGGTYTALDYPTGETTIAARNHVLRIDVMLHIPPSVKVRILEGRAEDVFEFEDLTRGQTVRITRHNGTSITGVVRHADADHVTIARKFEHEQTIGRNAIQHLENLTP